MDKKQTKINASYELTPTSHKGNAQLDLPEEAINELGLATARLVDVLSNSSKKVFDMFCNGMSKLGQPIGEIINGKTKALELANQSIYMKLAMTKEANMRKLIAYSAAEFDKKVSNGEEIPDHLVETDEILLIEENASMTSNEEFLKLWAKLYTEEACTPGSISRKTIKLVETLDSSIIKILENEIFPYCDINGFYWGPQNEISNLLKMIDYGLLERDVVELRPKGVNLYCKVSINCEMNLYCCPNYTCSSGILGVMYRLTGSAIEIYQNINKVNITHEQKNIILDHINESSQNWRISSELRNKIKLKSPLKNFIKFVVCDDKGNIIHPINSQYKNVEEFIENSIYNFEVLDNV